ncbi:MAG: hypothetical protein COW30_05925 [Rhodospirillales bacterium CG15_BIG_FIL_POST_REV_8_21_14_020_66_15]|nr:MAG: hypothetical protein COW30_05925 [Rhodospirillales bacterium CG15_BIG_FIL_POST_REV_8_21_14_020_66_15]
MKHPRDDPVPSDIVTVENPAQREFVNKFHLYGEPAVNWRKLLRDGSHRLSEGARRQLIGL